MSFWDICDEHLKKILTVTDSILIFNFKNERWLCTVYLLQRQYGVLTLHTNSCYNNDKQVSAGSLHLFKDYNL